MIERLRRFATCCHTLALIWKLEAHPWRQRSAELGAMCVHGDSEKQRGRRDELRGREASGVSSPLSTSPGQERAATRPRHPASDVVFPSLAGGRRWCCCWAPCVSQNGRGRRRMRTRLVLLLSAQRGSWVVPVPLPAQASTGRGGGAGLWAGEEERSSGFIS